MLAGNGGGGEYALLRVWGCIVGEAPSCSKLGEVVGDIVVGKPKLAPIHSCLVGILKSQLGSYFV